MNKLVLIFIIVFAFSCDECEDRVGLENVQVSVPIEVDSVLFNLSLDKNETTCCILYSSGWANLKEDTVDFVVYENGLGTQFSFEVFENQIHYFYLYDSIDGFCSQVTTSELDWVYESKNGYDACYYSGFLDCP